MKVPKLDLKDTPPIGMLASGHLWVPYRKRAFRAFPVEGETSFRAVNIEALGGLNIEKFLVIGGGVIARTKQGEDVFLPFTDQRARFVPGVFRDEVVINDEHLKTVLLARSLEDYRGVFRGVHFDKKGALVATDGFRLHGSRGSHTAFDLGTICGLDLAEMVKQKGTYIRVNSPGFFEFENRPNRVKPALAKVLKDGTKLIGLQIDGGYPDWRRPIPSYHEETKRLALTSVFDPEKWQPLFDWLKPIKKKNQENIYVFITPDGAYTTDKRNKSDDPLAEFDEPRIPSGKQGFALAHIRDALAHVGTPKKVISLPHWEYDEKINPPVELVNGGKFAVIVPLRLP
ncbi:MAG: hypothetical protein GXO39_05050 [Thermotogae bacterium]|nr:hypothetical protein [Thermotogota bacterium]